MSMWSDLTQRVATLAGPNGRLEHLRSAKGESSGVALELQLLERGTPEPLAARAQLLHNKGATRTSAEEIEYQHLLGPNPENASEIVRLSALTHSTKAQTRRLKKLTGGDDSQIVKEVYSLLEELKAELNNK